MEMVHVKSPDGGFYLNGDQFILTADGKGHKVVTAGGNITVDGAPYVILKSASPDSEKLFKLTITDDKTIHVDEVTE